MSTRTRIVAAGIVVVFVLGLRLLAWIPWLNPFDWWHRMSDHAHVVNEVKPLWNALDDYWNEHGLFPDDPMQAMTWFITDSGRSRVSEWTYEDRGELIYWTDGQRFILSWSPDGRDEEMLYTHLGPTGSGHSLARNMDRFLEPRQPED